MFVYIFQLLVQARNRGIFYSYTLPIERKNQGPLLNTASYARAGSTLVSGLVCTVVMHG